MKTAIVCYSFTHNNLVLAGELVSRVGGTLFNIEEKKHRTKFTILFDLLFNRTPEIKDYLHLSERFDHYILVAPVWNGRIATPLRAFLQKEGSKIKSYSFITVCSGVDNQKEKLETELSKLLQRKPTAVAELALRDIRDEKLKGVIYHRIDRDNLKAFEAQIEEFLVAIGRSEAVA